MNVTLWIITSILGLAFVAGGLVKLTQPREAPLAAGQSWVEDFSANAVKGIGALEVLGGVGLVVPALADVLPLLVPLSATGVVALMVGAGVTHARRREKPQIVVNAVIATLAACVAIARFGPYGL